MIAPVNVPAVSPVGFTDTVRVAGVVVRFDVASSHFVEPVFTTKGVGSGVEMATVWDDGTAPPRK